MSKLFVIRHGLRLDHENPSWKKGADRPFDSPLSSTGLGQAQATGTYLKPENIEAVYASPLLRTVQTGHAVADALDLPLFLEPGLIEWLNPKWYDFSAGWIEPSSLSLEYPRLQTPGSVLVTPRYPEIEKETVYARVSYVARQLVTHHQGPVVLITHGICVHGIIDNLTAGSGQANNATCAIHLLEGGGCDLASGKGRGFSFTGTGKEHQLYLIPCGR